MMAWGAGLRVAWPTLPSALYAHQTRPLPYLFLKFLLVLLLLDADASSSIGKAAGLPFLQENYSVTIYENSLPRTYVAAEELIGVPLENLPPASHITYNILEGDEDEFFTAESEVVGGLAILQIRTKTGLRDVLNRERHSQYVLSVEARARSNGQGGGASPKFQTQITVMVLDTNDNIPLFYPTSYQVSVGEDASLHTPLLAVTAHDADTGYNGQVYYSLENPESNYFAVHPTTGILSVTRPLSQIYGRLHHVGILAQDRGPQARNLRPAASARATVEVQVQKVNLHSPIITVHHLPHVIEHSHTHIYAIINVDDADEGSSGIVEKIDIIGGDPNRLFSITRGSHSREYNLAVLKLLDRELTPDGYNLTLQATDSGTPPRRTKVNVHVSIADVNDHAPVFAQEQYEEAVSEEAPPNTPVVIVAASDTDQGFNGKVLFRVVAGNEDEKFHINPQTGLISTAEWLDHESTAYYSLTVAAVDQASNARRKQSSAKIIIRVLDANDNAPQFNTPNTEVTLDENEPSGTYVTRVVASDQDSGENGFISYSIANLDIVPFSIDPFDGTVRTSSVLDFETQRRVYTIKVRASDWGIPFKRETETTVKVKVRDVNDNRPQFEGVDCKGWVSVDAPIGSSVLKLTALDLDVDSDVRYKLQRDMSEECWAMDASTGVLALTCDLRKYMITGDRPRTYVLNITATDGTHVSDATSVTVAIITDKAEDQPMVRQHSHVECHETGVGAKASEIVAAATENNEAEEHYALLPLRYGFNAHAPELPETFPSVVEIPEDAEVGTEIIKIDATDHDRGHNGRVVYAVSGGDTDSVFRIEIDSGVLMVWAELDHERTPEYVLNVTVYDLGVPHKSVSRNLTVRITDVNDNAPEFSRVSYSLHLPENTRNGTSVAQLSAQDADEGANANVYYKLVTDVEEFIVDQVTGILYVSGSLDRERRSEYDLRVRAWDSATKDPHTALARVLISILDMNDCPPEFGAASNLIVDVPEDLPLGAVVATLQATDRDLGLGGQIIYSLVSGYGNVFRIDEETGVVRVSFPLDFEVQQSYNITVRAQDRGSPPLDTLASLFVRIHDVDENLGPPVFPQRIIRGWVHENLAPGALVTTLSARDPDSGHLDYTITSGDGLGYFTVDKEGAIRTTVVLDRETARGYWLSIVVKDDGVVPLTDTCHVYVEVQDVNDHIPQTDEPSYNAYVAEDAPPGMSVIALTASDADLTPFNLTFAISGGNEDARFQINPRTGVVSTVWTLDRETRSDYELWVTVSDGQLSSVTPVFITVTDINDNSPEFLESLYRVTIPSRIKSKKRTSLFRDEEEEEEKDGDDDDHHEEDDGGESVWALGEWVSFSPSEITAHDDLVFRVFAKDADTGMNSDLDYSIKTGKGRGRFKIHPKTGQVYTKKAFTPGQTFEIMVQARDNGHPQLSATARVLVRVAPVPKTSAYPPELPPPAPAHVMETDPPGHLVTFVNAHDPENDTLWYYITDGDDSGRFNMGVDTGLVSLARSLDHEDQYQYTLTIAATDGVYTTTTKLVVEVMDANDHRPVFSARVYEGSVSESVSPGATVLALHCRDKDHSPSTASSAVYFSLHHSDSLASQGLFTIDSATGDIIVAKPLDREVCGSHLLTVSCRDRGRRENVDFARVLLTVTDDNDHHPVFFENTINAKVNAGSSPGTAVVRVSAVDHDKGDNGRLSYSIVEGNAGGIFSMDSSLGVISLTRELVDGDPREYLLLVRAMDHGRQARAASVPVRVLVASSPEAPPSWKEGESPKVVEVGEWTSVGTAIARLMASSPSSLQYFITGGNEAGIFVVSPASGVVSLATALDFETVAWYNLTVTATNLAGVSKNTWLGITVLDENDWWPEWDDVIYQGTVDQSSPIDGPILAVHSQSKLHPTPLTVTAVDRDHGLNGRVTYSIVEKNIAQYFSIDQHTGAVRVSGNLEDVAGMSVSFSVWATDGGDPRRECIAPAPVVITVRSIATPPLAFSQVYYSSELYLPTYVGVRVVCVSPAEGEDPERDRYTDSDKLPVQYSVVDGDETKRFAFDGPSKCLYVRDQLNLRPHYNLTLKATDGVVTSTATSEISVLDAPLSSLVFSQDKYWANVFENSTKEINVVAVGVKGQALNHHIEYSILNPTDTFEIRPTAGIIKTTGKPFDREEKDHYTLVVQARDAEDVGNLAHVLVHVAVMDVNDNEPIFVNQPYYALVSTTAERGHVVTKVRAIDADAGDFGTVRYELVRGSGELFAVNKKSGEISLKQSLMVADKTYSLTVAAYDGGKQPLSSQAHVMIRVVSAEGPIFSSARYSISVSEDAPEGTPVGRVEAASPSADPIMYTIVAGNTDELFALDYSTGVIQTSAPLDYEAARYHNLTVRARDPSTGGHTDTQVSITVTDVNDNPPIFAQRVFKTQVSEVVSKGQSITQVEAQDIDTGEGGQVRYRCESGCDMLSVGAQDGIISVAGVLDAETHEQYTMNVIAVDSGLPQLSATATVVIEMLDFNDNPPSWRQDSYSCRVSSEASPGHVISALSAHDPDTGQETPLRYSIHSGDRAGIFKIDPFTGVLTVTAPHKLENVTSVNLNVSVSDGVHMAFTAVHIEVVPSNHHTPRFSRPLYNGRIEENAAVGRLILTLEAEDPDSREYGTLHYSILYQTSEGAFIIDKDGNIFADAPLDRETISVHTIRVSVTDEGGKAAFTDVRVSVHDKNDNDPRFTLPIYQANIITDVVIGTTILKVEATDPDEGVNSDIQYQIYEANSSEALSLFNINPTTGEVTLAASVEGRENEVYQFFIRGEDGGSPRHHADVPVTIFLLPADDHPPQCGRKYAQFFVREDATIGTVITSLWMEGPQEVQYSILVNEEEGTSSGDDDAPGGQEASGPFAVSPGGLLVVRRPLDHERHHTHKITVTNYTLTTPPALDYMTISVVVMDVNDCAPRFSSSWYEALVAENSEVGAVVTILTATDDDDGNNGQIQYSLSEDEDTLVKTTFRIDPHSGSITLAAPLDRETVSRYSFTVVATDGGPDPLSTTATVTVQVKDYNDNPPVFPRDTYLTAVPEDTATGTAVLELSVEDADEVAAQLDYFVTGGDLGGHFLVHASGQVYVAAPLDRETQDEYTLTVTATDGKFTANTTVTVTVIDVNDNGPVCREPVYRREVSEGVTVGTHVVSVVAWDADEGTAARSRYILSGEGAEDFTIDQLSGHMATATQLDRETRDHYSLLVLVEDWEHPDWECEVEVEVGVSDINDNPPAFPTEPGDVTSATVPEDAPVNTVLLKMHASDPDLGVSRRVRYRFVDSADGHFSIDESEGVISLARPLDRETRDSYSLTVQAIDMGVPPLSSTALLTVTVTDVNDNAPEFVRKLLETTVAENLAIGTEVVRVMATSRDIGINADITYSIHHTTKDKYLVIHPKTGVISVGAPLDYERVHQVVATVVATDGGIPPLSSTALVNLTLTDINDNAPIFTLPSYTASVREDALQGASVLQISASDVDAGINSLVRYSISGGNQEHCFQIDQDTGIITVLKKLDREKIEEYEIQVSARDLGSPSNTAVTLVKVMVDDVNDNSPIFTSNNYSAIVQENRPVGYSMLRLMATDADGDPNGAPFTWELITPASESRSFTLDQDGSLRVATNKLNHLVQSEYTLSVRVWDSGSPPLHANTQVKVTVVEESQYPPTLFPLEAAVTSYRTAFQGGIIGRLTALDQDPYDTLQYSISSFPRAINTVIYFDVDGQDGTLVALTPLDAGIYSVNVTVSDGKFERVVEASIQVSVISEEMVENSVIVQIGPITPGEFLSRYQKIFLRAIAAELSVEQEAISILSLQPALLHSQSKEKIPYLSKRSKRDLQQNLDILIVVKKFSKTYFTRKELLESLRMKKNEIQGRLNLPYLSVMDSMCTKETQCSGHGQCVDVVEITEEVSVPYNTQLSSLLSPKFNQKAGCLCDQGYGGNICEELVNACGHRPCAEYEECTPTDASTRGYTCQCPKGRAGPSCQVDLTKCRSPSCHYPMRPLSFKGKSYAEYSVTRQTESSSLVLSVFLRTRHPVGTVVYAAGDIDYSILEVAAGHIQYRWDCGSGEGLVRVSTIRVDDNKWHFVNLTRDGTVSTLSVDGEVSSGAAPGVNDILNMDSDFMFLGATVSRDQRSGMSSYSHSSLGFVGCLDQITIDGAELPITISGTSSGGSVLKRLANVELQCPDILPPAGVCGSHPCLNGGTCMESGKTYKCTCPSRFTGSQCQVDTAPCSSSPCLNGGKCIVVGHYYKCQCPSKLSGKRCEYGVHCNPNPCQNGGRCEEGVDGPICKCQHFTGNMCQLDIDECTRNPCQSGGTCLNFYGGFKCICHSNVTGEYCTEAFEKPQSQSALNISLEELVCILAVFLGFVIAMLVLVAWQRRRWHQKRHQQNNRVKLTDHHVKNDLKANDVPKRNSKICNVEADQQGPPLPPRPASYTPSGNDSVILNTLKHLADLSAAGHESLELETLSRCSHELLHSLNKPVVIPPNLSPPPPSNSDSDSLHKPWDHHNNLNDSYFMPIKDVSCDLVTSVDESRLSPAQHSTFSDVSSVRGGGGSSPPVVPPLPRASLLGRCRERCDAGTPLEVVAIDSDATHATTAPSHNTPTHSSPIDAPQEIKISGENGRLVPSPSGYRYMWDDYDMRGSRTLLGCSGGELGAAATPDLLLLPGGDGPASDDDYTEGRPLLSDAMYGARIVRNSGEAAATPLLTIDARDTDEYPDDEDDEDDDDPCSFEEILMANNISLGSTPDLDNTAMYNIVSDLEDDYLEPLSSKISNVPCPLSEEDEGEEGEEEYHHPKQNHYHPKEEEEEEFHSKQNHYHPLQEKDINRLGSPRSRRPFHRTDYGRVSDLSFLSALEEDGVDDSLSELQDSEYENFVGEEKPSDQSAATLIQTSLSEVYL